MFPLKNQSNQEWNEQCENDPATRQSWVSLFASGISTSRLIRASVTVTAAITAIVSTNLGHPVVNTALKTQMAIAHQVETSGTVGGTIHIEPNDSPRAGEESLIWFALTQRGGQSIPLSSCDCTLEIYAQPYSDGDEAIATPELQAISAERYRNIPGANVTFPRAGAYDLVLTGSSVTSGAFSPFELTFSVTVAR